MNNFKNLRGTVDLLPDQLIKWQNVEKIIIQQLFRSSVKEIRTPILEMTELFMRGIGEGTDVVSKEMYTFLDRGERSCTLRPEGTASVARALIQHGISTRPSQKLWYMGPMFRYERPQAGRQRQFHQLGVEFIGYESVSSDIEIITLAWDILQKLGIKELNLEINTLGDHIDRSNFQKAFLKWLEVNKNFLDLDSQRRIDKNPLRILDTKNVQSKQILEGAPRLFDFLSDKSVERYITIKDKLKLLKIPFIEIFNLVRGLDYYSRTTFELLSPSLGAQNAICGGGRYDKLVEMIGGKPTPGIGFAAGIERIMMTLKNYPDNNSIDIYVVGIGPKVRQTVFALADELRQSNLSTECDMLRRSIKSQLREANKIGAKYAIIIGDKEFENKLVEVKNLKNGEQEKVAIKSIIGHMTSLSF